MLECLTCNKPLILTIDINSFKTYCKNCKKEYSLLLKNKMMIIKLDNKRIMLPLNNALFCEKELSKKILYELYNKGYVNCVKILNSNYNNHDSEWIIQVNHLFELAACWYNKNIEEYNKKIGLLNGSEQNYSCSNCNMIFSFEDAVKSDFCCKTCYKPLLELNIEEQKKKIVNNINLLKKEYSLISSGWA